MPKILLVEDNEMNRDMLSRRLAKRGYEIQLAEDAERIVDAVCENKPDLILMDIGLPGISGWDATRLLKANPETACVPVIALTAHALSSDREEAFAAGCEDFETKPVELPNLLAKIERVLAHQK